MIIVTALVTYVCGVIAKKNKYIETNLIPIQSALIGLIMTCIYYLVTKDFSMALNLAGLATSGIYDLIKGAKTTYDINRKNEEEYEEEIENEEE